MNESLSFSRIKNKGKKTWNGMSWDPFVSYNYHLTKRSVDRRKWKIITSH